MGGRAGRLGTEATGLRPQATPKDPQEEYPLPTTPSHPTPAHHPHPHLPTSCPGRCA